jgi:hypothetical protein
MPIEFQYDVFLSHSAKDKSVVRPLAERLRQVGPTVWPVPPERPCEGGFEEWEIRPSDSIAAKIDPPSFRSYGGIEQGLEHSRVLGGLAIASSRRRMLCMAANAFGSDPGWSGLEAGTFRFRDPLNRERRFIPLRLDDAPIKGSLAQFLYIKWRDGAL